MVLTDPPYNVSRENNFHTMGRTGIDFEWDGDFDQEEWLRHADRVLMPGGSLVIWNDYKVLGLIAHVLIDMGYDVKRPLTWIKNNPMPRNTTRLPVQKTEHGLWAVKPGAKWVFNKRGAAETFVFGYPLPRGRNGRPRHDAKKPDDLYGEIVEILSNPGELIVDPFCGGGTLAYAAETRGRQHISIDEDEKWVTETKARWSEAKPAT
jgi:site-specific DNA-methyltransferase (adenine-specific)